MERPHQTGQDRTITAFQNLFDETRRLFHRLRRVAGQVHGGGELTAARRGVLLNLHRDGPQTVPQMARARPVTRQHIQAIVNSLLADGLVELGHNPAHKRSRLVSLTGKGLDLVKSMVAREAGLLKRLAGEVDARELASAAEVLGSVRELFEGERWRQLVEAEDKETQRDEGRS